MINLNKIEKFSKSIRIEILNASYRAGSSSAHIGGAMSSADIVSVLFNKFINFPLKKNWDERDRFILSKGHACLVLYSALFLKGLISKKQFFSFEKNNSKFPGHPVRNIKYGIEQTTGSLAMGLSSAVGMALGAKLKDRNFKTFVLIGDGECNEGAIWEAAMTASKYKLSNLTVILDNNKFQQTGTNSEILDVKYLEKVWMSFDWDVISVDGHNIIQLIRAFEKKTKKPKLVLANTIKGKGISFFENNNDWHHATLTFENYKKALKLIKD